MAEFSEVELRKMSELTSWEIESINSNPIGAADLSERLIKALQYAEKAIPPVSFQILEGLRRKLEMVKSVIGTTNLSTSVLDQIQLDEKSSQINSSEEEQLILDIIFGQKELRSFILKEIEAGNLSVLNAEGETIEDAAKPEELFEKAAVFIGKSAPKLAQKAAITYDKFKRLGFDVEYVREGEGEDSRTFLGIVSPQGFDINPFTISHSQLLEATAALKRNESKKSESAPEPSASTPPEPRVIHSIAFSQRAADATLDFHREQTVKLLKRVNAKEVLEVIGSLSEENNVAKKSLFAEALEPKNAAARIIQDRQNREPNEEFANSRLSKTLILPGSNSLGNTVNKNQGNQR